MLKIAIIGCGNIGRKRTLSLIGSKKIKITFLVGNPVPDKKCYGYELSKIVKCNFTTNYEEIINNKNVDAVILCLPPKKVFNIASKFIKSGKHLLIEKPLGVNLKQAEKLYKLSIKYKVILKTGFNLRFDIGLMKIKKIIKKNLGIIYFCKVNYVNGAVLSNSNNIGSLLDLGSHIINLFQFYFNSKKIKVHNSVFQKNEYHKEDNGIINLSIGKILCTGHHSFVRWKNKFSIEIFGSKGFVKLSSLPKWGFQTILVGTRTFPSGIPKIKKQILTNSDSSWFLEIKYFLRLIKNKDLSNNIEGFNNMRLVLKIKNISKKII